LSRASSNDIDTVGPPKRREKPSQQAFGNRYDFGASLTAAMKTKPPADRTTLTARARSGLTSDAAPRSPVVKELEKPAVSNHAQKEGPKPSSLMSSKPCLESSVYKELVDKYCFVSHLFTVHPGARLTRSSSMVPPNLRLQSPRAFQST
jgi:hypothetical protein